ncbi:MAG: molybdopterin-dependent oxidoreductase [Actinobacteria bacterium]|nr:molybdopterin-dependent oxidoreductase [Actinomycetota bacterium]
MNRRTTNLMLLGTVAVLVATGLVAWILPESRSTPLYDLHRIAGIGLVAALPWKELIARTSLTRRLRLEALSTAVPGLAASVVLLVTVLVGLGWTVGLVSFDRPITYSAMNVHVFAGLALVPLMAWHTAKRWERPRASDMLGRRSAIRLLSLGTIATVGGLVAGVFPEGRRVTGSRHAGSFTGNDFPLTIWTFDTIPAIDPSLWRLEIVGAGERARLTLDDLASLTRREVDAILDCTGGWWSEQRWRGVGVREVLAARGVATRSFTVSSVTGHSWSFGPGELDTAILATHVGGEPLSAGHGAPVRLVVPGRRGFQWIKWVSRIALDGG